MKEEKYLIYVDIMGFGELTKEIASKKGIDHRDIKKKFLEVIKEKIGKLEAKGKITGKKYGESDDWLFVTGSIENIFHCIYEILDHSTGYRDYEKIPLEIAIGTGKYDKWASFNGINLIIEDSTIKFLKTNIVRYYHQWYKINYNNQSPKTTFVVTTESVYHELKPLDRTICKKIQHKYKTHEGKEQIITFFACDVTKIQQRGRIFEFLEKIGYAGNKWYERIDELYVPPFEYKDIQKTLKEKRIVFITGTPEYGKTFTAVRLMWEYYGSGYEPRWIKGGEPIERSEVRKKLENIRAELKPKHIIYLEDPFGKTNYESREGLEREIGTIIDSIVQIEDTFVIITSREEVFKEFEKEKSSAKDIKKFENKLNIKKPSYDYERRKQILLNWAETEDCKWLKNEELRKLVLESIKNEEVLPTPLSIRDFAVATFNIEKEDELKEKITEKSKETAKVFAKEIKTMTNDKVLFLSFMFFLGSDFEVEFIRMVYHELVKELNLKDAWKFDRVLDWFKHDKIEIRNNYLRFSHPSYSEALGDILVEDGHITGINEKIFSKLLLKLSEKDNVEAIGAVEEIVFSHFDKLPNEVRNKLLVNLSEKGSASSVAEAVRDNFDKLPDDLRNKLLLELSEKDEEVTRYVARTIADNFDKLPDNVRNILPKLLFALSENDWTAWDVVRAVRVNFDKLPDDVRNKSLLKLLEKVKLSEKDEIAWYVIRTIVENFNELPENVRNLLFKLAEGDGSAEYVAWAIADNFDKLPDDVRNLLDRLQKPLQQVIENLSREGGEILHEKKLISNMLYKLRKIQALQLISNALPKINLDFVLKILNELSKSEDEEVRTESLKLLKAISDDLQVNQKLKSAYLFQVRDKIKRL